MTRMQQAAVPDQMLDAAYRRTRYEVDVPDGSLVLQINVPSPGLLAVHDRFGSSCSTFLTAWNPRSVPQTPEWNNAAQACLCARLAALGLPRLTGRGCDPDAKWIAEESVLVPGLELSAARALAADLGQNAILHSAADAVPRLIWIQS